jgi:MFS family permease
VARIRSTIPARMDRLPWTPFHSRAVLALGITWVLDGIEISLAAGLGGILQHRETLALSVETIGYSAAIYLAGEVVGALYFGRLADRLGRRRLFIATLALYLLANGLTAASFSTWFFLATRFVAGMGIGGEYAAIHSAIDELIPAQYRGRADIAIGGTYWGGAMIAAGAQIFLLDPEIAPIDVGWRLGLLIGPLIGIAIWPLRTYIPESPRWQLTHGQAEEAERTVARLEADLRDRGVSLEEIGPEWAVEIRDRPDASYGEVARLLFGRYRDRSILGASLMITQSFLYNAIFFTYALILTEFYAISASSVAYFMFPFAIGNLAGPLLLGRYFDTIGRRKLIALSYGSSAILLALTGWLFNAELLTATTQTLMWCLVFFIASAGASAAYLTVSEIFPIEVRSQAIAIFFSIAQLCGAAAPALFGVLIGSGERFNLTLGYQLGAVLMFSGAVVAWKLGVDAERRGLEDIAPPLSSEGEPDAESPAD